MRNILIKKSGKFCNLDKLNFVKGRQCTKIFLSITAPSTLGRVGVGFFFLLTLSSTAQSWQWGKRGGGEYSTNTGNQPEGVYSIVTDSNKNIYTLSVITDSNSNVDGNVVPYYGESGGRDIILSSFACDGTYRWSKVYGGYSIGYVNELQIDAQNNVYVTGRLDSNSNVFYPPRIGDDLIISPSDRSNFYIMKINNLGITQWLHRLSPPTVDYDIESNIASFGISTDPAGNSYWFVRLPPGTFCDGAFTTTLPIVVAYNAPLYILKYDTNGNFVSGNFLNVQLNYTHVNFYRNHNNGNYYLSGWKASSFNSWFIAGQSIGNSAFVACLDSNRSYLWHQENVSINNDSANMEIWGLAFDNQNNVYVGSRMTFPYLNHPSSFMGYENPPGIPITFFKISANGQTLLKASHGSLNVSASNYGKITCKGNKVSICDNIGGSFPWDSQTLTTPNMSNQGLVPFLAVFDTTTGLCTNMSYIPNDLGTQDNGTAVAIDASGDIIMGGSFGSQLYVGGQTLLNSGGETDFFIAKYSTTACSPLAVVTQIKPKNTIIAYPNPASNEVSVCVQESCNYNIYSITGARLQGGVISQENNLIDISKLSIGEYNIQVINEVGKINDVMIIKK